MTNVGTLGGSEMNNDELNFIAMSEYERLQKENDRLKADNDWLKKAINKYSNSDFDWSVLAENEKLQAETEQLRELLLEAVRLVNAWSDVGKSLEGLSDG
jgi:hypothetical protein